jgi:AAA domain
MHDVSDRNGQIHEPERDNYDFPEADEWLWLVPEADEMGILARCTKTGLIVDTWSKPNIKWSLRGQKVIMVLAKPAKPGQAEAMAMVRESKAMTVKGWYPTFYGDDGHDKLIDIDEDFGLGKVLDLERPWNGPLLDEIPEEPKRVAKITVGLNEITCKKVEWLYENRIVPGFISLFAGRSGLGKSFVTCDIVARFSRGEPAPYSELKPKHPIRTLFVSEDSPEYVLGPRLLELKAVSDMIRFMTLDAMAEFTLDNTEILGRAFEECGSPGLIVIDPPANFLGHTDAHKDAEVRKLLKGLIAWIETYRVAAVLITHINKQIGKGMDAVERIMGSVAWGTTARITCAFAKDPDVKGQCLFGGTKNNLGELADVLAYRIDKTAELATVTWVGVSDTTMDDATDNVKKKSKGKNAVEWLEDRFRERCEWESTELKAMAKENGISNYALFESPEVIALPIKKRKRSNANGESYWVWISEPGWPRDKLIGKSESQEVVPQDDWYS